MDNAKPQEMNKENQTPTPELELVNKWIKNLKILPPFTQKLLEEYLGTATCQKSDAPGH